MLKYVKGDVTRPTLTGPTVLIHICNNVGAYGAGVALAIAKAFPIAKQKYFEWFKDGYIYLGTTQYVPVGYIDDKEMWVANMVAQEGLVSHSNPTPIKYDSLDNCLANVLSFCQYYKVSNVIAPRIGCGLAGGKWDVVEPLIIKNLYNNGIEVTIYDY